MRALLVWMTVAINFYCSASDNWAADPEVKFNLLALPGVRVAAEQLDAPAQIFGERITLRASVAQLAEVYQFSYWIDRQVDADKPLTLSLAEATLGECLSQLAHGCQAEVGLVENVVTFAAPPRLASMQYTAVRLHDQLSRGSPNNASLKGGTFNPSHPARLRPLEWPILTTPSELYQQIAKSWGFAGAVELPHDLMNAGKLHPCTAATQLTLLLAGFDRCAVGRQLNELRIAPLPKASPWQAVYDAPPEANVTAARTEFPDAKFVRDGKQMIVTGLTAAHLRLLHDRAPRANRSTAAASQPGRPRSTERAGTKSKEDALLKQRYTIKQDQPQPLRAVMTALAGQLGLKLEWNEALAPADLQRAVTLDVKDARLDDILNQLATQAGVAIVRDGRDVRIAPRGAAEPRKR